MRWIVAILIVLLVVAGVAYIVGMRVPQHHTVSVSAIIGAPQADVYNRISDVSTRPTWRPSITAITPLPQQNGHDCWRETAGHDKLDLCLLRADPFSSRVISVGMGAAFSGTWTYQLSPASDTTTTVTITEDAVVPSPFFRFGMLLRGADTSAKDYLKDLRASFPPPA